MVFGGQSECSNQPSIGYTPLSYFILGLIESGFAVVMGLVVFKRRFFSISQSAYFSFILPVYLLLLIFLLLLMFLIGLDRIVGLYPVDIYATVIRWFLVRSCTEGLSAFFTHHGIGYRSMKNSSLFGFTTAASSAFALFMTLHYTRGYGFFAAVAVLISILLLLFHLVNAFAPTTCFHRRPAAFTFSKLNALLLMTQLIVLVVALEFGRQHHGNEQGRTRRESGNNAIDCSVEIIFAISEFLQVLVIIFAFIADSMYWQGLYSDKMSNLNHPLLGIWDLNNRSAVKMVADSIVHLERKVVYIIPYSQLIVDTSRYFSGGSARVYRGMYNDNEVAIKFLFCIELTPERVVEFCNEATLLNSLQHEHIVHCYGVAIMPPAISLVTEYCTYGSLFDFLHNADWMVTTNAIDEEEKIDDTEVEDLTGTDNSFKNVADMMTADYGLTQIVDSSSRSDLEAARTSSPISEFRKSDSRHNQQVQQRSASMVHIEKVQRHLLAAVKRRDKRSISKRMDREVITSNRTSEQNTIDSSKRTSASGIVMPSTGGNGIHRSSLSSHISKDIEARGSIATDSDLKLHISNSEIRANQISSPIGHDFLGTEDYQRLSTDVCEDHTISNMQQKPPLSKLNLPLTVKENNPSSRYYSQSDSDGGELKDDEISMERRSWSVSNQMSVTENTRRIMSLQSPRHKQQYQYKQQMHNKQTHRNMHHADIHTNSNFGHNSFNSKGSGNSSNGRMQSAMSVMLSRELNYGLGPYSSIGRQSRNSALRSLMNLTSTHMEASSNENIDNDEQMEQFGANSSSHHGNDHRRGAVYSTTTIETRNSANRSGISAPNYLLSCISSSVYSLTHLLPLTAKLRLARDCCSGLAHLHAQNLMHCDVKSLNFLVTNDLVAKLADLGETRATTSLSLTGSQYEDLRSVPRNINWSSPEILTLHHLPAEDQVHAVTQAADVWSLAMVVWEILSGEVPFDHADYRNMDMDTFVGHLRDGLRPPFPKDLMQYTWLRELLDKAWSFEASDRIKAAQMCEILDEHML